MKAFHIFTCVVPVLLPQNVNLKWRFHVLVRVRGSLRQTHGGALGEGGGGEKGWERRCSDVRKRLVLCQSPWGQKKKLSFCEGNKTSDVQQRVNRVALQLIHPKVHLGEKEREREGRERERKEREKREERKRPFF